MAEAADFCWQAALIWAPGGPRDEFIWRGVVVEQKGCPSISGWRTVYLSVDARERVGAETFRGPRKTSRNKYLH